MAGELKSLQITVFRLGIETGACFWGGSRHVTVTAYHCFGEEPAELHEERPQLLTLFCGARVGRFTGCVKSSLVANADAATVVGTAVGTHFKELAVLA